MTSDAVSFQDDNEFWEMLPEETTKAYSYFAAFRDQGPTRTRKAVADSLGVTAATLKELAGRHSWDDRVRQYDQEIDRSHRVEIESQRLEMRKRHAGLAVFMQKKVAEGMAMVDPTTLTPKDLAYWLDLSSKLERVSRGEADAKIEVTGRDGGPIELAESLSTEDRAAYMAQIQVELARRLGPTGGVAEVEAIYEAEVVSGPDS